MALVKKQVSSQRFYIVLALVAVAFATGIYYVFVGTSGSGTQTAADPTQRSIDEARRQLLTVEAKLPEDTQRLYEDIRFQELRKFGEYPVDVGRMGRPNPFQPF